MTSLERVVGALRGEIQKRPPYTLTLSAYGARLTGAPLHEYYSIPNRYVEGQKAVYDLCSPDILFSPFATILEAAAFGTELHYVSNGPPLIKKPSITTPDEFLRLAVPDIDSSASLIYLRETTHLLSSHFANSVPVCGIVTSPVDLPALIMGMDAWIETLVINPNDARAILKITCEHFVSFANALLADGATFIALPMMFTNPVLVYKKLIDEIILPTIHSAFAQIKGPIVFHHGGNRIVPMVQDYLDLPNVAGFAIDSRDSLTEARECIGPSRLLLGNLNGVSLSAKSTENTVTNVLKILDNRKNDAHFIFATSAADVAWDTPPERVQAIADTIRSWENF